MTLEPGRFGSFIDRLIGLRQAPVVPWQALDHSVTTMGRDMLGSRQKPRSWPAEGMFPDASELELATHLDERWCIREVDDSEAVADRH